MPTPIGIGRTVGVKEQGAQKVLANPQGQRIALPRGDWRVSAVRAVPQLRVARGAGRLLLHRRLGAFGARPAFGRAIHAVRTCSARAGGRLQVDEVPFALLIEVWRGLCAEA